MKKIFTYTVLAALSLLLAGCAKKELDTNPYGEGIRFSALAPNPVMRGGELRILGSNLEQVTEVRFAGGVSVTDFQVVKTGTPGELRLLVPLEGPEVGPVTIVGKDGVTRQSFADLTFTEPIEVESFTPTNALSGTVLTFKGEYLNDVKTVIFSGDVMVNEFVSQSRHELSVKVPANALTGPVILSDVDEINDGSTIPNRVYSPSDLVIGVPDVKPFSEALMVKAGSVVTVNGKNLDMVQTVSMPNAEDITFEVSKDATTLSFVLPARAQSGALVLSTYDGDVVEVGMIETVVVKDLAVISLAEDERFKANSEVKITGSDLDLVTKVEFGGGVESSFYYSDGALYTSVPATAKDGSVTVTLESGAKAFSEDLEVVKPEILAWETVEDALVAGESTLTIEGLDLDLVTSAKMGYKDQGFIDCEFYFEVDELGFFDVVVEIPRTAYTGPIILTSEAGYETETYDIPVTYDEAVSITFDAPSFSMGKNISLSGSNLLKIEQVFVKGQKVTEFAVRTDDAMTFTLPEKVGPGVYRLELILTDGSELVWPVPFEVTAPFSETFYWEGHEDLGSWSNQPYLGGDGALAGNVEIGDLIRIYYTPYADWWQFEIFDGHWGGMSFPELGGSNKVTRDNTDPSATYFAFEVTSSNINALTSSQGWGGIFVVQGESVVITGVSVIHFGATETVVWEGPSANTGDYALNLELGGEDDWVNAEMPEGAEVRIYFTPDDPEDWSIQIFDGHWGSMSYVTPNGVQWNNENSPEAASKGYVSFIAEGNAYTALTTKAWWGFALIVQGKNLVVNQLTFQ